MLTPRRLGSWMKHKTLIRKRYITLKVEASLVKWLQSGTGGIQILFLVWLLCVEFFSELLFFCSSVWQKNPVKLKIILCSFNLACFLLRPVSCFWLSKMYTKYLVYLWNTANCAVKFKSFLWFVFKASVFLIDLFLILGYLVVNFKIYLAFLEVEVSMYMGILTV